MFCRTVSEMMSTRLDGMLSQKQLEEMDVHLGSCESCRRHWQLYQLFEYELTSVPQPLPSDDFTAKVLSRLSVTQMAVEPHFLRWLLVALIGGLVGVPVLIPVLWLGINLWPVFFHPALVGKVVNLALLIISISTVVGRALWSVLEMLDSQDLGLAATAIAPVALILVFIWSRLVTQCWQPGNEQSAAR